MLASLAVEAFSKSIKLRKNLLAADSVTTHEPDVGFARYANVMFPIAAFATVDNDVKLVPFSVMAVTVDVDV